MITAGGSPSRAVAAHSPCLPVLSGRVCPAGKLQYSRTADATAQAQLQVIHLVVDALSAAGVRAWLFGGWGLDARIGRITRDHGDIEFWVERSDAARSKAALVDAGAMKEQFPALRNGRPWRDKDISDIAVLRGLLSRPS